MNAFSFIILSVILTVTASPLGNHGIFRRHNGAQALARRYVLESRMDIPPRCASASRSTPASSDSDISEESSFSSFVQTWKTLCPSSGGDIYTNDPCSQLAGFAGVNALMEFADPCDQQHIADSMITFAKSKGIKNKDSLIKFALQYRKHYRNSVEILGVIPSSFYCMETPVNSELDGVSNAQMSGTNPGIFGSPSSPLAPFGSTGTCPLGMTADMSTCSCTSSASSGNSTSSDGSSGYDSYNNRSSLSYDGSTNSAASTYSISTATDSSYANATATYSSYYNATATYSSYVNATTTSSYVNATATYTSSYVNATTAYTSSYVNATATYSSYVNATAYSSYVSATTTDSSNSTATATATYYSSSLASATDSRTMTATDSTSPAATVAATSTFLTGPNIQPTDISGDVNDPAGR